MLGGASSYSSIRRLAYYGTLLLFSKIQLAWPFRDSIQGDLQSVTCPLSAGSVQASVTRAATANFYTASSNSIQLTLDTQ